MRPFTKALLEKKTKSLPRLGLRFAQLNRCFETADELLDCINKMTPNDYIERAGQKKLRAKSLGTLRNCLNEKIPSSKMRILTLQAVSELLSIGEKLMNTAAYLYRISTFLYKNKYALSQQTYSKDVYYFMLKNHTVPIHSFPAFKTGKNPAFTDNDVFSDKCAKMYVDTILNKSQFEGRTAPTKNEKNFYTQWLDETPVGQKFSATQKALQKAIQTMILTEKGKLNKVLVGTRS